MLWPCMRNKLRQRITVNFHFGLAGIGLGCCNPATVLESSIGYADITRRYATAEWWRETDSWGADETPEFARCVWPSKGAPVRQMSSRQP